MIIFPPHDLAGNPRIAGGIAGDVPREHRANRQVAVVLLLKRGGRVQRHPPEPVWASRAFKTPPAGQQPVLRITITALDVCLLNSMTGNSNG